MSEYSKERLAKLAGITTKTSTTNRSQIIKENTTSKNAKLKYAIISEGSVFYIKESKDGGKTYNYIGGENNKNKNYSYTKLSVAENNLNFLMKSINEGMNFGYGFKNEADEEVEDQAPIEDAPAEEETAPAPEAETETEPTDDMPMPDDTESGDAEGMDSEATAPEGDETEGEDDFLADIDSEGDSEAPAPEAEGDGEAMTAMEAAGNIQSILGQVTDSGAQETFNALAQILSAIDDTLMGMMTPEDLVKSGEKFQELADKYAPKQEGKKMGNTMKESRKQPKKLDDLNESEIKKLIEKYDIMNKPKIKYKLKKLSETKERAKLLENKIEKKRLIESKSKKKIAEDRETVYSAMGSKNVQDRLTKGSTMNTHNTYTYSIDLDERGYFNAHVDNPKGEEVYRIDGYDIFEDGFMKHKEDLTGLAKYLSDLGIIPKGAKIVFDY